MKTFLSLLMLGGMCAGANATLVLSDSFTYANGVLTNVSAGQWRHTSGGLDEVNVSNGAVELTRSETEDVASSLAVSYLASSGTALYSRFTVLVLAPPTSANGNYFAHLDGGSARARVFAVTNGAAAGKFRLGLANGSTTASVIWPVDLHTNQTYTVVTRQSISTATARLWVNPASDLDASITAGDVAAATGANAFAWRQDSGLGTLLVDSLVVATSFGEALSGNESPALSDLPDQQVVQGASTAALPFTVQDAETSASALTVFAQAANSNLAPGIVLGGSGPNRTVTVTTSGTQTGSTALTVFVTDGTTTNSDSFTLTVIPSLLLLEGFDYVNGPLISPTTNHWSHQSGATTGQVQVVEGKIILSSTFTEDVSVELLGGPFATNSGVQLYASFVLNFSRLPSAGGDYLAHFNNTGARGRLFVGTAGAGAGKFRVGLANGAASVSESLATDLATNVNQLIVLRYNLATGISTVWANPRFETDPSTNATDVAAASALSTFAFREDPGIGTCTVDNLRLGLSFASVLSAPPALRLDLLPAAQVRLRWPVEASDFSLQSSTNLGVAPWQDVLPPPVITGGENVVTNASSAPATFFRLKQ